MIMPYRDDAHAEGGDPTDAPVTPPPGNPGRITPIRVPPIVFAMLLVAVAIGVHLVRESFKGSSGVRIVEAGWSEVERRHPDERGHRLLSWVVVVESVRPGGLADAVLEIEVVDADGDVLADDTRSVNRLPADVQTAVTGTFEFDIDLDDVADIRIEAVADRGRSAPDGTTAAGIEDVAIGDLEVTGYTAGNHPLVRFRPDEDVTGDQVVYVLVGRDDDGIVAGWEVICVGMEPNVPDERGWVQADAPFTIPDLATVEAYVADQNVVC